MATLMRRRTGHYTFDDFLALVQPDQKADLLNGVIYMASPESTDDNKLGGWLYKLMSEYAEILDLGEVYITRVAFRLGKKNGPEPDLGFVSKRRLRLVQRGFVGGAPDLAVEIVSPSSVERDYEIKFEVYEKAGVQEYWILDPDQRKATFFRRSRARFREVPLDGHFFESTVLPGLRLDVRWFWSARRPSAFRLLQKLLKGR